MTFTSRMCEWRVVVLGTRTQTLSLNMSSCRNFSLYAIWRYRIICHVIWVTFTSRMCEWRVVVRGTRMWTLSRNMSSEISLSTPSDWFMACTASDDLRGNTLQSQWTLYCKCQLSSYILAKGYQKNHSDSEVCGLGNSGKG